MKINSLSPNMFSAPFITMLTSVFAVVVMTESASHDFLGSFCTGITCDNGKASEESKYLLQVFRASEAPSWSGKRKSIFCAGMECLSTIKKGACDSTELYESLCFSGFSGQNFYFPAEAGEIYNLLSAQVSPTAHIMNNICDICTHTTWLRRFISYQL
jgi:hypothetical protein